MLSCQQLTVTNSFDSGEWVNTGVDGNFFDQPFLDVVTPGQIWNCTQPLFEPSWGNLCFIESAEDCLPNTRGYPIIVRAMTARRG